MNKEFIPYEQALALKELGFDEPCFGWYQDKTLRIDVNANQSIKFHEYLGRFKGCFLAPTFSQCFRWFREKHDLQASNIMFSNSKYDSGITRYKGTQSVWGNGPIYDTFEEAELACLNKLIEIVKDGTKINTRED
jgi:hypothetical protein